MEIINKKLFMKIKQLTGKAVADFNMISEGDRIAVGVSGGKDSYTLLHLLEILRTRAPVRFSILAVNIDAGFEGYRREIIEKHLRDHGFESHMENGNYYDIIEKKKKPGTSYCSICARFRRGVLYTVAQKHGCNKIALGHHLDDFIETLLLNQFYVGKLKAMSPSMVADNGIHTVIRPLVYVEEADIIEFSAAQQFPVICCACPVCGMIDQKRKRVKRLVKELSRENPYLRRSMIKALANVEPRYLLDTTLAKYSGEDGPENHRE